MNCYKCDTLKEDTFYFFQKVALCKQCMNGMSSHELKSELTRLRDSTLERKCFKCQNFITGQYADVGNESILCAVFSVIS